MSYCSGLVFFCLLFISAGCRVRVSTLPVLRTMLATIRFYTRIHTPIHLHIYTFLSKIQPELQAELASGSITHLHTTFSRSCYIDSRYPKRMDLLRLDDSIRIRYIFESIVSYIRTSSSSRSSGVSIHHPNFFPSLLPGGRIQLDTPKEPGTCLSDGVIGAVC